MSRRRSPINRDGLSGLLGASAALTQTPQSDTFVTIDQLHPGPGQPRREFNQEKLQELARSIEEHGILQPLLVRPAGAQGTYEIIAGERRWRAAQLAQLKEIPVAIRDISDQEAKHLGLIENLQREDLNMVDEVDAKLELVADTLNLSREAARARLIQLLREDEGVDHRKLEKLFGTLGERWSNFAKTKLRILNWPEAILNAVRNGLPYTLAGVIVTAPPSEQARLLQQAQAGASRAELKAEIERLKAGQTNEKSQLATVGRILSNQKWSNKLSAQELKELDVWLSQMPEALKRTLEDSRK